MIEVDSGAGIVRAFGREIRCVLGKGGVIAAPAKREGDGATPLGTWPLRGLLLRPGRVPTPATRLPWRWLRPDDGWSDDPADPAYNRPVAHPHNFSAESLWRDDQAYDLILVLGHNDLPPVPGRGSAIFWHVSQPDMRPTEGCVAMPLSDIVELLPHLEAGMPVQVR